MLTVATIVLNVLRHDPCPALLLSRDTVCVAGRGTQSALS